MKPENKKRFALAMGVMGQAFQKVPSDPLVEIYWKVLQDMSIETFEAATQRIINTRIITGTFPLVAEIRDATKEGKESRQLAALTAWDKLVYGIHNHAPYDSVIFDDPIIYHIVRAWGGWVDMGDWPEEETKWKRKEFIELYLAYSGGNMPDPESHLIGLSEYENRAKFPEFVPKPFLIGGTPGRIKSIPYTQEEQRMIQ
jgi:hypothetical protein